MRWQQAKVDEAAVEQTLQRVYATRVYLGLPLSRPRARPDEGPAGSRTDLFRSPNGGTRNMVQTTAQIGLNLISENVTPPVPG